MKLFLIIYFAGKIVGSVGPLNYSMNLCNFYTDLIYENGQRNFITKDKVILHNVDYNCEMRESEPIVGSPDNRTNKVHEF
jgi:hypothetical protein